MSLNVLPEAFIDELMEAVTPSQYLAHKVTKNLRKNLGNFDLKYFCHKFIG
jgi:hypothetical protein